MSFVYTLATISFILAFMVAMKELKADEERNYPLYQNILLSTLVAALFVPLLALASLALPAVLIFIFIVNAYKALVRGVN
jgi:hypothetical protein